MQRRMIGPRNRKSRRRGAPLPIVAPERRRGHISPSGMALALLVVAGCLYALHCYDQRTLRTALAGQRVRDGHAEAAALTLLQSQSSAALARNRLAAATRQAAAVATMRSMIPTLVARTALAAGRATDTAVAAATATALAGNEAAATATARAQPGVASICTATNYDPSAVYCRVSDPRIAVGDASNGRLVVDASNTIAPRDLTIDVAQTQPDGSLAGVNNVSAALNGAVRKSWRLSDILPANVFGGIYIGQYEMTVRINGRALPLLHLTVYH